MEFRPCIDIHNGKVKQIVGSSVTDSSDKVVENYTTDSGAAFFAKLYRSKDLSGGHVIILDKKGSPAYELSKQQAFEAFAAYPDHLMAGGGIDDKSAKEFTDAGASHVIVTSFVFSDGKLNMNNLEAIRDAVGTKRLVLDLSCKKTKSGYLVATNRWQMLTSEAVDEALFEKLAAYCDEFLVHAVDMEGRSQGIDENLIRILASSPKSVCYAGGVSSYDDIKRIGQIGKGAVNFTVGSKLDIFGGDLSMEEIIACTR